jgi:hypothetical protein
MKITYKDITLITETKNIKPLELFEECNFILDENKNLSKKYENVTENDLIIEYNEKEQVFNAKEYLASTDFKMTADYDKPVKEVKKLRKAARELIRSYEDQ